jgi:AhpD family alkylhydroperoxidase
LKKFPRRTYRNLADMLADFRDLMTRRQEIKLLMRGHVISRSFRERLMLAVTQVNGCRYCSYYHAQVALTEGISREEIIALGQGVVADSPQEEASALLYAQHWAETDAQPDAAVRARVVDEYGEEAVGLMELAMRLIRSGNLLGNGWDAFLFRLSFGRWGA